MDSLDKIVPQAPQPDTETETDAIVDAPEVPEAYRRTDRVTRSDEPAKDVGGEIGRKRLNAWQIAALVAGGVAAAAGIAAVVYMRSRNARPDVEAEKLRRKAGLKRLDVGKPALGYADQLRAGIQRSREQFDKAPIVKSVREKVSALLH